LNKSTQSVEDKRSFQSGREVFEKYIPHYKEDRTRVESDVEQAEPPKATEAAQLGRKFQEELDRLRARLVEKAAE
jgi:hypothetical protein